MATFLASTSAGILRARVEPSQAKPGSGAVPLLPYNEKRLGVTITNLTSGSMLIDFGPFLTEEDYSIELPPGAQYEMTTLCSDEMYALWRDPKATGKASVREFIER